MMGSARPRTPRPRATLLALCSLVVPTPLNSTSPLILPVVCVRVIRSRQSSSSEQVRMHAEELLGSVVCVSHEVNSHT